MNYSTNRWLLIFLLLLGLILGACNSTAEVEEPTQAAATDDDDDSSRDGEDEEQEEEAAVEESSASAEEAVEEDSLVEDVENETAETDVTEDVQATSEEEANEEEGGLFSSLFPESLSVRDTVQEFDSLNSYEMSLNFSTTTGEVTQAVETTILVSNDPPQSQMTMSFTDYDELIGISTMSITQIEDTNYTYMADFGCVTTSEGEMLEEDFGIFDANEILGDVGEATLVGEETINGIETVHYSFDETTLENDLSQFNWASGDVYVAQEGNYVVRFHLEGEGEATALGAPAAEDSAAETELAFMQIDMELLSVNEPVNITVPEACENGGLANSEFPVLEDAFESSSFGGILTYKTEATFADAVTFYQDSLTADGWTYQEDSSFILEDSTALMYFAKEGRALTVTISIETDADALAVVIFEE